MKLLTRSILFNLLMQSLQYSTLDFGTSLEMFKDCSVHIVLHHYEGAGKKFIVKPLDFPIVLFLYHYERHDREAEYEERGVHCKTRLYKRKNPQSWFMFEAPPSGKLHCFVQIFVNAIPCDTNDRKIAGTIYDFEPPVFNPIFDYQTYHRDTDISDPPHSKYCTFLIHVETDVSSLSEKEVLGRSHYIYHTTIYAGLFRFPIDDNPTKIIFWVEVSDESLVFEVVYTAVITTTNHGDRVSYFHQHCLKYIKNPYGENLERCLDRQPTLKSTLVQFDPLKETWGSLELMRLSHSKITIEYQGKFDDSKPINVYLYNWKAIGDDIEPILIGMMLPNTSILDPKTDTMEEGKNPSFYSIYVINPTSISTRHDTIEFITCVPISKKAFLSLIGYVNAFDLNTWLYTSLLSLFSVMLWHRIRYSNSSYSNGLLLVYSILVGQSTSAIDRVKWLSGAWVLAGLFLTYNYQGNNIDQLTSPLAPKKLETFDEVLGNNLTLYSLPLAYESLVQMEKQIQTITDLNVSEFSSDPVWDAQTVTFSGIYKRRQVNQSINEAESLLTKLMKAPTDFNESLDMLPLEYYASKISKCKAEAFVDRMLHVSKLQFALKKLKITDMDIATSKTPYGRLYQMWVFKNLENPPKTIRLRYLSLIESGLVHLWSDWKFRIETWNITVISAVVEASSVKSFSTEDNIVVVFYLHLTFLAISLVLFILECRMYIKQGLVCIFSLMFVILKSLRNSLSWFLNTILDRLKVVKTNLMRPMRTYNVSYGSRTH